MVCPLKETDQNKNNKIENINTLDLKEREIYLKKGEYYLSLAGVEENEYGEYELGIEEVTYGNRPIVYPNPSVGELIISNVSSLDLRNIEILDITGKSINSFETNLTKIDVSQLKSGIYFLRLKDPSLEKIEVYKFIKE